jgi:hypothetical protein
MPMLPRWSFADAAAGIYANAAIDWKQFAGQTITLAGAIHPWSNAITPLLPDFTKLTGIEVVTDFQLETAFLGALPIKLAGASRTPDVFMFLTYGQGISAGWLVERVLRDATEFEVAVRVAAGKARQDGAALGAGDTVVEAAVAGRHNEIPHSGVAAMSNGGAVAAPGPPWVMRGLRGCRRTASSTAFANGRLRSAITKPFGFYMTRVFVGAVTSGLNTMLPYDAPYGVPVGLARSPANRVRT